MYSGTPSIDPGKRKMQQDKGKKRHYNFILSAALSSYDD